MFLDRDEIDEMLIPEYEGCDEYNHWLDTDDEVEVDLEIVEMKIEGMVEIEDTLDELDERQWVDPELILDCLDEILLDDLEVKHEIVQSLELDEMLIEIIDEMLSVVLRDDE